MSKADRLTLINALSANDIYRLWKLAGGMSEAPDADVKAVRAGWTWADDFPNTAGQVRTAALRILNLALARGAASLHESGGLGLSHAYQHRDGKSALLGNT